MIVKIAEYIAKGNLMGKPHGLRGYKQSKEHINKRIKQGADSANWKGGRRKGSTLDKTKAINKAITKLETDIEEIRKVNENK